MLKRLTRRFGRWGLAAFAVYQLGMLALLWPAIVKAFGLWDGRP